MPGETGIGGPDANELIIALVAAVGTDLSMISDQVRLALSDYAYETVPLRLSDYLADETGTNLDGQPFDERLWGAMDAGDLLRQKWGRGDALALRAILDIATTRYLRAGIELPSVTEPATITDAAGAGALPPPLDRVAFVLRSLKTQDELATLRAVYGPRLVVIAAFSPKDDRLKSLQVQIEESRGTKDADGWTHSPEALVDRDEKEDGTGGQDVSGTFHRADFFIRGWNREVVCEDLTRTMAILFGSPFRTPTREEHGQFIAAGAALRSAEFGRQVGAALMTHGGSVISLGTNEVPAPGGGSPWEEDLLEIRDFELGEMDTNRREFNELAERMADHVGSQAADLLKGLFAAANIDPESDTGEWLDAMMTLLRQNMPATLRAGGLKDLTEFGRAVHAEMNAILDAGRRGIPTAGATLHSTTYPCHNCARHIIAAGITRVVFIEPYPKSRAMKLHSDAIEAPGSARERAVAFTPFVGVAPRRYAEMFDAASRERLAHTARKDDLGRKVTFEPHLATPVFSDGGLAAFRPEAREYRWRELLAIEHFGRTGSDSDPSAEQ